MCHNDDTPSSVDFLSWFDILPFNGERDFEDDITSHVEDTLPTCDGVVVGVFESAQVVLVSFVGEVGAGDAHTGHTVPLVHDISAHRCVEQAIGRRGCLGIIGFIVVVLLEVVINTKRNIRVVQHMAVMQDFPLDI